MAEMFGVLAFCAKYEANRCQACEADLLSKLSTCKSGVRRCETGEGAEETGEERVSNLQVEKGLSPETSDCAQKLHVGLSKKGDGGTQHSAQM